jgi:O-antigen/teichoic acid export membrane protein
MQLISFLKKDFVKNVMTLITGSVFSQLIIYAALLVLTRLFSRELFGVYVLFSSAILILKPIVSLQLDLAVVLPKRNKDAVNIFVLSVIILFILNLFLFGGIFIFKAKIITFFKIEKLSNFIYLLPLASFFFGFTQTLNYWNNRIKSFKNIAKGNIIKASFLSTTQIITGASYFNSLGLIPGMILGQIIQVVFLYFNTYKTLIKYKKHLSFKRMFFLFKKYKDIPLFNTLINFSNSLSNEIPVIMITRYFGLNFSGVYGLALKVGRAPLGVTEDSVSQVFFNKATETYNNKGDLYALIKKTFYHLIKIGAIIFIPILAISFFLDIIFGKNWSEVGLYLRILSPWLFIAFLTGPITSLISIFNKQKVFLLLNLLLLVFRFFAFYIGNHFFKDILVSLILFSAVGVIFNTFTLTYFIRTSKLKTDKKIAYQ